MEYLVGYTVPVLSLLSISMIGNIYGIYRYFQCGSRQIYLSSMIEPSPKFERIEPKFRFIKELSAM